MPGASALSIIREEHAAVSALLRSLRLLAEKGPGEQRTRFFETARAMLFYLDEFPERRHHPNESSLLFPMLLRAAPDLQPVIEKLEADHAAGEHRVRELQHMLVGWEFLGEARRAGFVAALQEYVRLYLQHMQVEETHLLPQAARVLTPAQHAELDAAFAAARDPLAAGGREPIYEELFDRIVQQAPSPIGLGQG
ncbi:hemerythrin domain-containing protein [Ramlibacter sp. AN1133]|uniref:hemerythrin domain-containing protein n=1 Tax=Ramlibacter sp. AN1133 TaxID=3133429 RepID=UPI0030BB09B5